MNVIVCLKPLYPEWISFTLLLLGTVGFLSYQVLPMLIHVVPSLISHNEKTQKKTTKVDRQITIIPATCLWAFIKKCTYGNRMPPSENLFTNSCWHNIVFLKHNSSLPPWQGNKKLMCLHIYFISDLASEAALHLCELCVRICLICCAYLQRIFRSKRLSAQ